MSLLVGCGGAGPVRVPVPQAEGASAATARACRSLHAELPDTVDDRDRRPTTPASVRTAAWGDPAVVLRCGVPEPPGLKPTSEIIEVNGVAWFLVESRSAYTFTTVGRAADVEVAVPRTVDRAAATAPLVDVARAVKRSDPKR